MVSVKGLSPSVVEDILNTVDPNRQFSGTHGGNENSPDHMGALVMRCDKLRSMTGAQHAVAPHRQGRKPRCAGALAFASGRGH